MSSLLESPQFLIIAAGVALGVFLLTVLAVTVARFYRRCGADEALVRTGAGGNKVVIGGGIFVYPVLHQLMRVSLRSIKLIVERSERNALVTRDKIKANVTTELYVKVEPLVEDVLAAARSFGERSLDEQAIGNLIEGKLTDALRSVAANQTFMDLHSQRKQFAESIQSALAEELKKNGLTLENVSITGFAMVSVTELDGRDVFDAEGLRAITESVQTNAEKTNQIQREKELAIRVQNVEAKKRTLTLEQEQAQAEADQQRQVAEYAATQKAETTKAVLEQERQIGLAQYDKQRATETARIVQEQAIAVAQATRVGAEREAQIAAERLQQAAEIQKQREIEAASIEKEKIVQAAEIEKRKEIETALVRKQIAIVETEEAAARAAAQKALAQAEEEGARQQIVTVELTARANREKEIAIIKAEEQAEQARIAAEREAARIRLAAEADAEARRIGAEAEARAIVAVAEATRARGEAEAEVKRKAAEAENATSLKVLLRDVTLKALDVLPEVTEQLMRPAHAIKEIKVMQLQGGGGGSGSGPLGVSSPILKTILEAGAAYPLFKELLGFAEKDGGLPASARALFDKLPPELKSAALAEPELAKLIEVPATELIPEPEEPPRAAE